MTMIIMIIFFTVGHSYGRRAAMGVDSSVQESVLKMYDLLHQILSAIL